MIRSLVLAPVLAGTVLAATAPATPLAAEPADTPIPLSEWRGMTEGKTVYYYIDGEFFGREYYWPGEPRVTFQHASGTCADARWTYEDGAYCFYFDRPHCFAHVRRGDGIFIIPQDTEPGEAREQSVRSIVTAPFTCTPGLTS